MFLNTHAISDIWLHTSFKKNLRSATGIVTTDERARKNAIPDQVQQSVRDHIAEIPSVDSHYVRNL